jgi:hypothetical protein
MSLAFITRIRIQGVPGGMYFNIRNTLPKSGTFLLGHPVYIYVGATQKFGEFNHKKFYRNS